jgi:RNA polymerase sigma factor (sigma-70 family)
MSVTVEFDWDVAGDAELVGAAVAGDRAAFAGIYDRYADRLHDFCAGMVGSHDAADCVQEAFCMAAVDLPSLRDPVKLRPWLYSIARHQALRTLRARQRETIYDEMPDSPSTDAGPDALAARNELATLVTEAEGGLTDRDREVLDLAYRHGLTGVELAQALGVSNEAAKKMVQRLRDTVARSLGALLIARQARSGQHRCAELATVVAGWDGQFTILVRKRISRHIESCPNCDEHRGRLVNPKALLGASPVFLPAPDWLRAHTLTRMQAASVTAGVAGTGAHSLGLLTSKLPILTSRFAVWAAAIVAVPALALGVAVGWPALHGAPITPVQVGPAPATSTSQAPTTPAHQSDVPAPQPNTAVPPAAGPAHSDEPNSTDQGQPIPIPQAPTLAPAPAASVAPNAPTVAPTTHVAPASVAPTPSATPPAQQQQPKPTKKRCADGESIAIGQSCPAPQAPPQTPAPQPPKCSHVAVPGNPSCPNATQAPKATQTPDTGSAKSGG